MASALSRESQRQSCIALVASITEPPPTATRRSAAAARAARAPATTSSRGLCDRIAVWLPACREPRAFSTRCSGPSCFCASERVEVTNTRLAPRRSASATTASAAGVPKTMRSWAVTLKVPLVNWALVPLIGLLRTLGKLDNLSLASRTAPGNRQWQDGFPSHPDRHYHHPTRAAGTDKP